MIKFHPTPEQLKHFAMGGLSATESLVISAHCDMCSHCSHRLQHETEQLAKVVFEEEVVPDHSVIDKQALDVMMANITQTPAAEAIAVPSHRIEHIELDGKIFALPRTLQRFAAKTGNWSSMVGKLWQAPVEIGDDCVGHFIYMGQGGGVPEHTHRGSELTLVINGEFSDGLNNYDSGDFLYMNGEHTHAPRSDSNEGCLVFSIVDQPLHFTSGLARLLNPFSHLFFR